jgi:predicted GIY-YIG superfamily endonuclease
MFYVYLIESITHGTYYIGQSSDVIERINNYHNKGRCKYTKNRGPWKLLAYKTFPSRGEAMTEEKRIKKLKNSEAILKTFDLKKEA